MAPEDPLGDAVNVAVIVVPLTMVTPEIVRPLAGAVTWIAVPAVVKPLPVSVTGIVTPRRPEVGAIDVSKGVPGETTVNGTVLVFPPGLVKETFRAVRVALGERANVAVTVSGEFGHPVPVTVVLMLVTVIPEPVPLTAVEPAIPHPVKDTVSEVPWAPVFGAMELKVPGGTTIVKVTALLVLVVPLTLVVTVTFLAPPVAKGEIASVAVTCVSLPTVTPVAVTPNPETLTAVLPVRPLPVSVIGTVVRIVPRLAEAGLIEVSTGPLIENGRVGLLPPGVDT